MVLRDGAAAPHHGRLAARTGRSSSPERCALLAPLALRRDRWDDARFRLLYLCSLLLYVVLFNHQAERASYLIAFTGATIWFALRARRALAHVALRARPFSPFPLMSTLVPGAWLRTQAATTVSARPSLPGDLARHPARAAAARAARCARRLDVRRAWRRGRSGRCPSARLTRDSLPSSPARSTGTSPDRRPAPSPARASIMRVILKPSPTFSIVQSAFVSTLVGGMPFLLERESSAPC